MSNNKIFVQIASYRDKELLPTIKHAISRSKFPENLRFVICWQHSKDDIWDNLDEIKNNENIEIIDFDYKESKGACWARNITQMLWKDEKFSLQIDSHMRFVENWDEKLINIWESLNDEKAIITGYPPNYNPEMDESKWYNVPQICNVYRFDHKYPMSRPMNMEDWQSKNFPVKGVYISAGFIFGPGQINREVPYDPDFYFSGEEAAMAIRYFTHGYNIYNSHRTIVHHFYQRLDNPKHWGDHNNWGNLNKVAHDRLDCLLGRNDLFGLGMYGLGKERTLQEYTDYSGIDFVKCIVHKDTEKGIEPPCSNSEEGWDNEQVYFNDTISWDYDKIEKINNVRFWAMIVLDQGGIAIHREDLTYNENKDIIDGKINSRTFKFYRSKNRQIPTQLLIWPYSEDLEWKRPSYFKI
jgi:hypothetical protein